ncbi:MAG: response regulator [Candidatus Hydrogenedens sp.]|nr:response regulator [Candidatus Hydrogenedens sp.]
MAKHRILVVDDESLMREYVEEAMLREGYAVDAASSGAEGLALFDKHRHDVVVTDLKMRPMDGIELLGKIIALEPNARVIVMTAYGTIETAVSALRAGAEDYILKPFTPDALGIAVERALTREHLVREAQYLRAEVNSAYDFERMVGASKAMRDIYAQIQQVASSRATVFVRGESGTGKELVARAIHHAGARRDKPFIKVNCAALSAGILESELFGHERGAFTNAHERKIGRFELADSGTLLLDEISEIGIELQPKLLRALQEREFERVGGTATIEVDTRIVATSNRDLERAVAEGAFREDLFFRLNVITIELPPLRQRKEDIQPLAEMFLERYKRENGRRIQGYSSEALGLLQRYDWPGNVRELQNAVERAVVLFDVPQLEAEHFRLLDGAMAVRGGGLAPGTTVADAERQLILKTLEHCDQNRTRAAELLDISVRTLRNKLAEYRDAGIIE